MVSFPRAPSGSRVAGTLGCVSLGRWLVDCDCFVCDHSRQLWDNHNQPGHSNPDLELAIQTHQLKESQLGSQNHNSADICETQFFSICEAQFPSAVRQQAKTVDFRGVEHSSAEAQITNFDKKCRFANFENSVFRLKSYPTHPERL
jgi:hypothetical protein